MVAHKLDADKTPADKTPADKTPADKAPADKASADNEDDLDASPKAVAFANKETSRPPAPPPTPLRPPPLRPPTPPVFDIDTSQNPKEEMEFIDTDALDLAEEMEPIQFDELPA